MDGNVDLKEDNPLIIYKECSEESEEISEYDN